MTGMAALVKRIITVITLTLAFALPAAAQDFEKGLAAQKRGDFAAALRIWRPLAERGDAAAQNQVGLLYDNGEGVSQDHGRALAWYRRAARQGHADAQYNLGLMYANGLAVRQNYNAARMWYQKAARQGHREAKVNLDVLYLMGHVTRKAGGEKARAERAATAMVPPRTTGGSAVIAARSENPGGRPGARPETRIEEAEAEQAAEAAALSHKAGTKVATIGEPVKRPGTGSVTKTSSAKAPSQALRPAGAKTEPAAANGNIGVQLSSVKTRLRAMKEASRLKQAHATLLGSLEIKPVRVDLGDRGIFYRLRAGPLSDWRSAKSLCRELSSRNQGCIVIRQ